MHKVNPFRIAAANHTNAQRLGRWAWRFRSPRWTSDPAAVRHHELQQQALAYGDAVTFCLTEPNCAALVSWGFTDKFSWVPGVFSGSATP